MSDRASGAGRKKPETNTPSESMGRSNESNKRKLAEVRAARTRLQRELEAVRIELKRLQASAAHFRRELAKREQAPRLTQRPQLRLLPSASTQSAPTPRWVARFDRIHGGQTLRRLGRDVARVFRLGPSRMAHVDAAAEAALYRLEQGLIERAPLAKPIDIEFCDDGEPPRDHLPKGMSEVDVVLLRRDVVYVIATSTCYEAVDVALSETTEAEQARIQETVRHQLGLDRSGGSTVEPEHLDPRCLELSGVLGTRGPRRKRAWVAVAATSVALDDQVQLLRAHGKTVAGVLRNKPQGKQPVPSHSIGQ